MKKIILFSCFFVVFVFARADKISEIVTVEGVGGIISKDLAKARDDALKDAQRKAVEKGIGIFITSDTVVQNAQLIEDNIYTQSIGYIESYDVLKEWKDDYMYYVKIKANVKTAEIGNKLILMGLIKKIGDPRIMVIIPEYRDERAISTPIVESGLLRNFIEAGYRIVDQEQAKKVRYSEKIKMISKGDESLALEIAHQFEADIIIVGSVSINRKEVEVYGTTAYKSSLIAELKAIKVDNGEMIYSENVGLVNSAVTSFDSSEMKVLENCVKIISDGGKINGREIKPIIPEIAKSLLKKPSIQIILTGIKSNEYIEIIEELKITRFVKGVFSREMSGNSGRIDVDFEYSAEEMKKIIEGLKSANMKVDSFSKNKILVSSVVAKKITVEGVSFSEFKTFLEKLSKKGKIVNKSYSNSKATLEILYMGDMFELGESMQEDYEIKDLREEEIIFKKKQKKDIDKKRKMW